MNNIPFRKRYSFRHLKYNISTAFCSVIRNMAIIYILKNTLMKISDVNVINWLAMAGNAITPKACGILSFSNKNFLSSTFFPLQITLQTEIITSP